MTSKFINGDGLSKVLKMLSDDINDGFNKMSSYISSSKENSYNVVKITYADLVSLRNSYKLIPGQYYQIIDYVTTSSDENTMCANNYFDVVVLALDENSLSEEAYAVHSVRDDYFASSNLNAWKLWYCLDNDTNRFAWAGATKKVPRLSISFPGGWGDWMRNEDLVLENSDTTYYGYERVEGSSGTDSYTVFWFTQEYDSEISDYINTTGFYVPEGGYEMVPLDVSIISITLKDVEIGKGVIYRMIDEFGNDCPYDFKNILFKRNINLDQGHPVLDESGEETWVYTFCGASVNRYSNKWSNLKDGSLEAPYGHESDEMHSTFHHNVINPWIQVYEHENEDYTKCGIAYLNDNVFLGYWEEIGSSIEEIPYYAAECCYNNVLSNNCYSNTFGHACYNNVLSNNCCSNTFGYVCDDNVLSNNCCSNTFGYVCDDNRLGNNCYSNYFHDYCNNNVLDTNSYSNTFGHNCGYIKLGVGCYQNTIPPNFNNIIFENNVGRILFNVKVPESYIQNYKIGCGITNRQIDVKPNLEYTTIITKNSYGEIIEFCEADLNNNSVFYTPDNQFQRIDPNKVYVINTPISALRVDEYGIYDDTKIHEYKIHFVTSDNVEEFKLPAETVWANGEIPSLEPNTFYELSIVNTTIGNASYFKAILTSFK